MWGLECDMQIQLSWFLAVCNKKRLNSGTAEIYGGFLFVKPFVCFTTNKQKINSHVIKTRRNMHRIALLAALQVRDEMR